jgi:hypothetical protein
MKFLGKINFYATMLFIFFVCSPALSQVATSQTPSTAVVAASAVANVLPVPVQVNPDQDFLALLLKSLGGLNGASALAIAGIAVQLLIKLMSTSWLGQWFPKLNGGLKILIVTGLSLVSGVLALMLPPTSLTLGAALMHSTTMTAFMVFGNQLYQQLLQPAPSSIS